MGKNNHEEYENRSDKKIEPNKEEGDINSFNVSKTHNLNTSIHHTYLIYVFMLLVGLAFVISLILILFPSHTTNNAFSFINLSNNIKNPVGGKEGILKSNELLLRFYNKALNKNNPEICNALPIPFSDSCKVNFYSHYALKIHNASVCYHLKKYTLSCILYYLFNSNNNTINHIVKYCNSSTLSSSDRDLCYLYVSEHFNLSFCKYINNRDTRKECMLYFQDFHFLSKDDQALVYALIDKDKSSCYKINNKTIRDSCFSMLS